MKNKANSRLRSALVVISASASLLSSPLAFSGGYEKPDSFSGKWGALGGAAASSVSGGEALFFNPAGLAGGESTFDATGDLSPTVLNFSGPLAGNASVNSDTSTIPAYGVFVAYKINPKWGIALGSYLSGGAKSIYSGVNFANVPLPATFGGTANPINANTNATIQSDLSIVEFSVGTGYEILDGLRLGIDYRMAMVHASLGAYGFDPVFGSLTTVTIDGISGTAWNGFRLGLQYYPKESRWGIGAQWRSQVNFTGTGTVSGSFTPSNSTLGAHLNDPTQAPIPFDPGSTATVSNALPQQFDVGAHYDIVPNGLRMHLQYTFTNYSVDQTLAIAGGATVNGSLAAGIPSIDQQWHNENDLRVGFDCFEMQGWVFRASYVYSSAVTPADRARATFTPPGSGHTVAVGAGTSWLNNALETNLALEYGFSSADTTSSGAVPLSDGTAGTLGKYTASDFTAHMGVTYRM